MKKIAEIYEGDRTVTKVVLKQEQWFRLANAPTDRTVTKVVLKHDTNATLGNKLKYRTVTKVVLKHRRFFIFLFCPFIEQ